MKSASSKLLLTPAIFERCDVVVYAKEVNIFFNLTSMSSRKKNAAEEKNKTEYFSWSDA